MAAALVFQVATLDWTSGVGAMLAALAFFGVLWIAVPWLILRWRGRMHCFARTLLALSAIDIVVTPVLALVPSSEVLVASGLGTAMILCMLLGLFVLWSLFAEARIWAWALARSLWTGVLVAILLGIVRLVAGIAFFRLPLFTS